MSHAPGPAVARPRPSPPSLASSLVLPAAGTAPGRARATLRDALARWGLSHLSDSAEAITSELVTNAVAASGPAGDTGAGPGDPTPALITVWITVQGGELCIHVWDADPVPPPRDYEPGTWDENGRGLMIVKALSQRWDWYPTDDGGKYVWAALSLTGPRLPGRTQVPVGRA
jgi:anti-sigma regulatory factor (Ser/Thr protein kinase)